MGRRSRSWWLRHHDPDAGGGGAADARKYWVEINKLLVPFGKYVCTGRAPGCSTCPVLKYCRQVGVTEHR